jgi:hypothetical protein
MSKYHTDKGDEAIPLPSGVDLTELQAARDAVREDPGACIKEIGRGERTSKEGKLAEELTARISALEEVEDAWSQSAVTLWDFIACEKLNLKIGEEMMDKRVVSYSTLHLNGIAILVAVNEQGKGVFYEYLRHKDTWFRRPLARSQFKKKSPCPPNIPTELILESSAAGTDQGIFYDQSGPHTIPEGFEILGSYRKADLANARAREKAARGEKSAEDASPALVGKSTFKRDARTLDPLIAGVLKPCITVGAVLQAVVRGTDGYFRYSEPGVIAGVRVFDQKQRS